MESSGADSASGFERVLAYLRERLLDGTLKPGERLMAERELVRQLGVSRPIVREALRALHMLGIVEIRDRIGTVVKRPDASALKDFFTLALAQQADLIDDVMEARIAIECQAVRLACERATIADFEKLQRALIRIGETIDDADTGSAADFDFHRAIVLAARSPTLAMLHESMATLLAISHRNRRLLVQRFDSMKSYLVDDHKRVFDAIVKRDPDRAEVTLRRHFAIGDEYRRRAVIGEGDRADARTAQSE
ncbi:FadR/GntR family transcriptional regulator [Bradyrhizobium sp. LHD-71]|uniref:FadR/GntR family transcriptional regulator n=1 Tax=Bradyrhizobium sp. LHD-71 TaxID=3072141 RepID=UPI00280D96A1|nr:FadR/GntR family transcriptional regulator [Bradyrhizobium sp. LHD-71]MDQ8732225.1 FadR/GntR family transcriptional regulator [Bradyrhizobium sp. LHD-71]